jgi:Fatty acid desaturase
MHPADEAPARSELRTRNVPAFRLRPARAFATFAPVENSTPRSIAMAGLVLTDPDRAPTYGDGRISRWCRGVLCDPRDEVFARLTIKVIVIMSLAMVGLFVALHRAPLPVPLEIGAIGAYLAIWGWYSAPVILMLHNTMHRPFIRRWRWLNRVQGYVMSFYFGIPTGYAEHHLGMHHVEDNMSLDLSSTRRYRRDSFLHFLVYFGRFFFLIAAELPLYLLRKRRRAMAWRALGGEIVHLSVVAAAIALDWRFGLVAFALPTFAVRFLMMAGNWGQHAFLNPERKNDGLANSITCINSGYNKRAFNDGYHIGHHLKANRHWTEMPGDMIENRDRYAREGAIVFDGLDFFLVSVLLWTGCWGVLAKRYVRLDGAERSDDEIAAMLKSRVLPLRAEAGEPAHA